MKFEQQSSNQGRPKRQKSSRHEHGDNHCYLPPELVTDILLRLPVKSLGRSKSVCKSWNNLISTRSFVESHNKRNNHRFDHGLLFELKKKSDSYSLTCNGDSTSFMSTPMHMRSRSVMGSTNGLVFVKGFDQIVHILNPITKACRDIALPRANPTMRRRNELYSACGFGYFPSMEDYKLVWITYDIDGYNFDLRKIQVHIFSLRNDRWRVLDISEFDTSIGNYASFHEENQGVVLLNDAFYWVVPCNERHIGGFVVLKFDVVKETLTATVNLRRRGVSRRIECYFTKVSIGAIGDDSLCVCQLSRAYGPTYIDMWKLKTEEGKGDWELLFRIGLGSQFPRKRKSPLLLGFVRNGDIFLQVVNGDGKRQIWRLDPNTDTPTYELFMEASVCYVTNFGASLISPYMGESSNDGKMF